MPDSRHAPHWAWFDGRVVPFGDARVPIEDRGLQFGESLYELVAVVEGSPFRLDAHIQRMSSAAAELGLAAGVPPVGGWEEIVRQLYQREQFRSAVLYVQLTGGVAPRRHIPVEPPAPLFFAYLRPQAFPGPSEVARGISVITVPDSRWQRSDLKTPMLLPSVMAKRDAADRDADEAIFIGKDGYISDGTSSSVFVIRQRSVHTAQPNRRTLQGTSTEVVREICHEVEVPFSEHFLTLSDLKGADEVFVTSTTRLLMPVVRLDGSAIGTGGPGPVSLQLAYHYQRLFWGRNGP